MEKSRKPKKSINLAIQKLRENAERLTYTAEKEIQRDIKENTTEWKDDKYIKAERANKQHTQTTAKNVLTSSEYEEFTNHQETPESHEDNTPDIQDDTPDIEIGIEDEVLDTENSAKLIQREQEIQLSLANERSESEQEAIEIFKEKMEIAEKHEIESIEHQVKIEKAITENLDSTVDNYRTEDTESDTSESQESDKLIELQALIQSVIDTDRQKQAEQELESIQSGIDSIQSEIDGIAIPVDTEALDTNEDEIQVPIDEFDEALIAEELATGFRQITDELNLSHEYVEKVTDDEIDEIQQKIAERAASEKLYAQELENREHLDVKDTDDDIEVSIPIDDIDTTTDFEETPMVEDIQDDVIETFDDFENTTYEEPDTLDTEVLEHEYINETIVELKDNIQEYESLQLVNEINNLQEEAYNQEFIETQNEMLVSELSELDDIYNDLY